MTYWRDCVDRMNGYTPGEQPRDHRIVKLNTNENPYPPCPGVSQALAEFDVNALRRYPDPSALELRREAARLFGLTEQHVLCGNGSDDLLTIGTRTFIDQGQRLAFTDPSYSLYPVLAQIQDAIPVTVPLTDSFDLPDTLATATQGCGMLFLARPNAPTGNSFDRNTLQRFCKRFPGIVWIDEAYADFADDHCVDLVPAHPNVVVSRTVSKSYSLAGIRLGLAFAAPPLVAQMMKVKDSYNVNMLTQQIALAALRDQDHVRRTVKQIRRTRAAVADALAQLGFHVLPSQANFLCVEPPLPATHFLEQLRQRSILVRHFPGPRTGSYVRVTIGTDREMDSFVAAARDIVACEC